MTRMTVLQRGIGSMERAEVRDQPELHLTITESLYKVFVRLEFHNFYINIDNIRRRHLLNIHNMQTKKVSSQDTLCFIHTSIPDC